MLLTMVSRCAAAASADSFKDELEVGDNEGIGIDVGLGGEGELLHWVETGWNAENLRDDVATAACNGAEWKDFMIS